MPDPSPHEVIWWRDEHGHPQQTSRANGEAAEWAPMSKADFDKTFPAPGDDETPEK
jgi:hypothetical protein